MSSQNTGVQNLVSALFVSREVALLHLGGGQLQKLVCQVQQCFEMYIKVSNLNCQVLRNNNKKTLPNQW